MLKQTTPFLPTSGGSGRSRTPRFTHACGARPLDGYTIKRGIGIGGFGEVYFAISDAGKEVALKRIQRNLDIELRGVGHCLNLKHVNLISLWDVRTDAQGVGWVVMEYVPGESLREEIERHPQGMPLKNIAEWFRSITSGVRYLHDQGIVHRDLKPGNIFRDCDSDVVKIGDYGLSKLIGGANRNGHTETVGTFHYMAPEVGRGSYGKEVDLYALGVILFEMFTGSVPFDGETSQEIIMKHLTASPDLSSLPKPFDALVALLLEKDPLRRCHEAADLIERFEQGMKLADKAILNHESVDGKGPKEASIPDPSSPRNLIHRELHSQDETMTRRHSRTAEREVVYIADEPLQIGDGAEMVFGEVVEIVTAETIDDPRLATSPNPFPLNPIPSNHPSQHERQTRAAESSSTHAPKSLSAENSPSQFAPVPPVPPVASVDLDSQTMSHGDIVSPNSRGFDGSKVLVSSAIGIGMLWGAANPDWVLFPLCLLVLAAGLSRLAHFSDPSKVDEGNFNGAERARSWESDSGRMRELSEAPKVDSRRIARALLVALLGCFSLNVVLLFCATRSVFSAPEQWAFLLWLTTLETLGISGTVIRDQVSATRLGRPLQGKVGAIVAGVGLGLVSYLLAQFLWVDFGWLRDIESGIPLLDSTSASSLILHLVLGTIAAVVVHSGRNVDRRRERLLAWDAMVVAALIGYLVGFFLGLPANWSSLFFATWLLLGQLLVPHSRTLRVPKMAKRPEWQQASGAIV